MRKRDDLAYFTARAAAEREAAKRATDHAAAAIHRELAQRYEDKLKGLGCTATPKIF